MKKKIHVIILYICLAKSREKQIGLAVYALHNFKHEKLCNWVISFISLFPVQSWWIRTSRRVPLMSQDFNSGLFELFGLSYRLPCWFWFTSMFLCIFYVCSCISWIGCGHPVLVKDRLIIFQRQTITNS